MPGRDMDSSIQDIFDEYQKIDRVSHLTPKPPSRNGKGAKAYYLAKLQSHDLPSPFRVKGRGWGSRRKL